MKWLAICLNALLILTGFYIVATEGMPDKDEVFIFVVLFAAPVSSLIALSLKGSEGWIRLYFKRKALEEKKKIEELSDQKHGVRDA
jgi:hypothetical protein